MAERIPAGGVEQVNVFFGEPHADRVLYLDLFPTANRRHDGLVGFSVGRYEIEVILLPERFDHIDRNGNIVRLGRLGNDLDILGPNPQSEVRLRSERLCRRSRKLVVEVTGRERPAVP